MRINEIGERYVYCSGCREYKKLYVWGLQIGGYEIIICTKCMANLRDSLTAALVLSEHSQVP